MMLDELLGVFQARPFFNHILIRQHLQHGVVDGEGVTVEGEEHHVRFDERMDFRQLAEELRTSLGYADRKAKEVDAGIIMIGILPTLDRDDLVSSNLSAVDRYTLLNDQIVAAIQSVGR